MVSGLSLSLWSVLWVQRERARVAAQSVLLSHRIVYDTAFCWLGEPAQIVIGIENETGVDQLRGG